MYLAGKKQEKGKVFRVSDREMTGFNSTNFSTEDNSKY